MSLRAIFRFENLDSTKDLNDRFSGLFVKGVYEGGEVKASATGTSAIVSPFKALTDDGMAVISDEDIVVPVDVTNNELFIVLNAYYVVDGEPYIDVTTASESEIQANKNYVKLAKKISATSYNYSDDACVDKISPVGRNHYRGTLTSNEFASLQDSFAIKDWCFVIGGTGTTIQLKISEDTFAIYQATNIVDDKINNHIQNLIKNSDEYDESMGGAGELKGRPTIGGVEPLKIRDGDETRACDIGEESYGSFNITSEKWFSIDSIRNKWIKEKKNSEEELEPTEDAGYNYYKSEYASTPDVPATDGKLGTFIDEYFVGGTEGSTSTQTHSRGTRFYDSNNVQYWYKLLGINLPEQTPSVNVRHITENYPLLPTLDEKYAMVGNFLDDSLKPSKDNRFVTQSTVGFKMIFIPLSSTTWDSDTDWGAYLDVPANVNIYAKTSSDFMKYVRIVYNSNNTNIRYVRNDEISVKDGTTVRPINSSDFETEGRLANKGYLKAGLQLVLHNSLNQSVIDGFYVYVAENIDEMEPDILSPYAPDVLHCTRLSFGKSGSSNKEKSGALYINTDEELVFEKDDGTTYKVMLIKDA